MSCIAAARASQPESARPKWPKVVPEEDAFHFISLLPDATPLLPANEAGSSGKESEWLASNDNVIQWMSSLPEKDAHSLARCSSKLNQKVGRNAMASSLVASPRSPGKKNLYKELLETPTKPASSPRKHTSAKNSPKGKGKAKALFQSMDDGSAGADKAPSSPTSKKLDPQMRMFLEQVKQDQAMAPSLPSHVPVAADLVPGSPLRQHLDQLQQWNNAGTPAFYSSHTLGSTSTLPQTPPFSPHTAGFMNESERAYYTQGQLRAIGPYDGAGGPAMPTTLHRSGSFNSSVLLPVPPQMSLSHPAAQQLPQYGLQAELDRTAQNAPFAAGIDSIPQYDPARQAANPLLVGLRSWNQQQQVEQAKMQKWLTTANSPGASAQRADMSALPPFPSVPYPHTGGYPPAGLQSVPATPSGLQSVPATPSVASPVSVSFMLDPPASQTAPVSPTSPLHPSLTTGAPMNWPSPNNVGGAVGGFDPRSAPHGFMQQAQYPGLSDPHVGQHSASAPQQGPHVAQQFGLAAELHAMQQQDPTAAGTAMMPGAIGPATGNSSGVPVDTQGVQQAKEVVAGEIQQGGAQEMKKKKWFGWCSMCRQSETSSPKHKDAKGERVPVELTPERAAELEPHVVKLQRMRRKAAAKNQKKTKTPNGAPEGPTPPAMLHSGITGSTAPTLPENVNGAVSAAATALAAATSASNSPDVPNGPSVYNASRLAPQSTQGWPHQQPDSPLSPQVSPMYPGIMSPPTSPAGTMLQQSGMPGPHSPYIGPNSPYVGSASPQLPTPPVVRPGQPPGQPSALSPMPQVMLPAHQQQQPSSPQAYAPPHAGSSVNVSLARSPQGLSPRNVNSPGHQSPRSAPGSPTPYPNQVQPPSPAGPSPLSSGTPPSPLSPPSPTMPHPAPHHAYPPIYSANSPMNPPSEHSGSNSTITTANSNFMSAFSGSQSNLSSITGPGFYTPPDSPMTSSTQATADRLQTYNNPLTPNSFTPNTDSSPHFTFNNPLSRNLGSNMSPLSSPSASPHPQGSGSHLDGLIAGPSPGESPTVLKHYNFFSTHNSMPLISGSPQSSIPSSPASSNITGTHTNMMFQQGIMPPNQTTGAYGYMPGTGGQQQQLAGSDVLMAPKGLPSIRTGPTGVPTGLQLGAGAGQQYESGVRLGPQPAQVPTGSAAQWSQDHLQEKGGLKLKKSTRRFGLESSF